MDTTENTQGGQTATTHEKMNQSSPDELCSLNENYKQTQKSE